MQKEFNIKQREGRKMNNTNETGRSMVEMLGVLAIIGVLSIGGIAGYTQAMRRYRANEILNAISMLAVTAKTRTSGEDITYEEAYPGSTPMTGVAGLGDDFKAEVHADTGLVTVTVNFNENAEKDCQAVLSMINGTSLMTNNGSSCGTQIKVDIS